MFPLQTNLTGALAGATTGFTYDGTNRVRTVTDAEGYSVTFDYDALDRPLKVTYPDGTFEQIVYKNLDPVLQKDRRGHWTATYYDALRRVTDAQDALNRVTHFEWCSCGSLAGLTDPLGRLTTWARDVQGRVRAKIYPDNTQTTYAYEPASGRLQSMTDAKSQVTRYAYFHDDHLQSVSYANAAIATPGVSFTYDTNYNRLATMTDGIGVNAYAYYPITSGVLGAGRLMSVDGSLANDTITYS
jgi:YD repeat-containing protein